MRIITLVTLIFLPGTFISVCGAFSLFPLPAFSVSLPFVLLMLPVLILLPMSHPNPANQYKFTTSNHHLTPHKQTLLSTDIIRFPFSDSTGRYQRQFSRQALGLYLAITLPLMGFTFLVAWLCWRWYKFGDRRRKLSDEESEGDCREEGVWNGSSVGGKGDEGVDPNEKV
jgi:hypothetical protein